MDRADQFKALPSNQADKVADREALATTDPSPKDWPPLKNPAHDSDCVREHMRFNSAGRPSAILSDGRLWNVKPLLEAALRKMQPVGTVMKNYFPLADRARAAVAWLGNEKHNPGERLYWARGKSDDHLDCAGRHLTESDDWDVTVLPDGRVFAVLHAAQAAWRASALAQIAAEKYRGTVIVELENPNLENRAQEGQGWRRDARLVDVKDSP